MCTLPGCRRVRENRVPSTTNSTDIGERACAKIPFLSLVNEIVSEKNLGFCKWCKGHGHLEWKGVHLVLPDAWFGFSCRSSVLRRPIPPPMRRPRPRMGRPWRGARLFGCAGVGPVPAVGTRGPAACEGWSRRLWEAAAGAAVRPERELHCARTSQPQSTVHWGAPAPYIVT